MGGFADRMARLQITVAAPAGDIGAELNADNEVAIFFTRGSYGRYDEDRLERQLAQMARLLWVEWKRAVEEATRAEEVGYTMRLDPPPRTERDAAFRSGRDAYTASGECDDGSVRVSARGMTEWSVRLRPGTLASTSETEFTRAASLAARRLIEHQIQGMMALRHEWSRSA